MKRAMDVTSAFTKRGILIVSLLVLFPSGAWSANFFSWDADSSLTSKGECRSLSGSFDTKEKFNGSASLRLLIPGNKQGHVGCEPGNISLGSGVDGAWLYYRWWMKIDSSFSWEGTHRKMKSNRVKRQGDVSPPIYTLYLAKNYVRADECHRCNLRPQVFYNFNPATNPAVTDWQEYIIGIKKQTGNGGNDGEFHFWVNGQEIGNGVRGIHYFNGENNWVEAWGANMVRPYPQLNGTSNDGGLIWVDDLSLDNTWNSTFPDVDKTPPNPPTGLSIR